MTLAPLATMRGNIFLALFGAVTVVGLLGYGTAQYVRGPLTTSTNVTRANLAETQMMLTAQVAVLTSVQGANSGDCDNDGKVEPVRWQPATGTTPYPTGGGLIPTNIGVTTIDPWGTEYGYCVWDHGTQTLQAGCKDSGQDYRLAGGNTAAYPAIAVISAGRDKKFQTICSAWADTSPADGAPDTPLVATTSGADDIVIKYTYAEAAGLGAGLWTLKNNDPTTATIAKDLEVTGNATLTGSLSFGSGGLILPDQTALATCSGTTENQIRRNTTTSPPTLEICYDNSGSWAWGAISGSGGGGGGNGTPGGSDTQVQYNDSGAFGGDSSLVWDETNNRLGIGAASPLAPIDLGNGASGQKILVLSNGTDRYGLGVGLSGDSHETNFFAASDGSNGHISLGFVSTSDGTTYTERARLTEGGRFGLGDSTPNAMLHVAGEMILGATALNCANSTKGAMRYNNSTNLLQFCNGATWGNIDATNAAAGGSNTQVQYNDGGALGGDADLIWDASNNRLGIGVASPVVALDVNGAVKVSTDATACSSSLRGAIRLNTTDNELEFCNATEWKSLVYGDDTGSAPTAPTGMGYLVVSSGTTTGNLGGLTGADTFCYNDLTGNNWNGKTDATTRNILTAGHVKAFLCDRNTCNTPLPGTTYIFARSGNTTYGGATLSTDGSALGPNNTQFWSGNNYLGGDFEYWTYRYGGVSETAWDTGSFSTDDCSQWASSSAANQSYYGHANAGDGSRWLATSATCDKTLRLLCMVHP